jgi:hypothetical protein
MAYTTINKSTDYFNTKLYTGNGGTQAITGVGHQPDLVWVKDRSNAYDHGLFDAVRGVTKDLRSNTTMAESANANSLTAFGTDGFTVGSHAIINGNNNNYASWNWKANGAGSANTDGSINSTVSVNTTAGFSIVKFIGNETSGDTVGHGLGSVPAMIIVKKISSGSSQNWRVYHKGTDASAPQDYDLKLNLTNAKDNDNTVWNDTAPTSSVFTLGNSSSINASGATMIAYCFAEKTGYSKFGTYTGNGNADGTFVYTGFKPAFVMIKRTDTTGSWYMLDNKRNTFNVVTKYLKANENTADSTVDFLDFTSNGFKMISTGADVNTNGASHIYMAFGQSLVGSNNVPCTAR